MDDDLPPEETDAYDVVDPRASEESVDDDGLEPEEAGFMQGYQKAADEGFDNPHKSKRDKEREDSDTQDVE